MTFGCIFVFRFCKKLVNGQAASNAIEIKCDELSDSLQLSASNVEGDTSVLTKGVICKMLGLFPGALKASIATPWSLVPLPLATCSHTVALL